jgi:hypothetical protein
MKIKNLKKKDRDVGEYSFPAEATVEVNSRDVDKVLAEGDFELVGEKVEKKAKETKKK